MYDDVVVVKATAPSGQVFARNTTHVTVEKSAVLSMYEESVVLIITSEPAEHTTYTMLLADVQLRRAVTLQRASVESFSCNNSTIVQRYA